MRETIIDLTIEEFAEEIENLKRNKGITLLKVNENFSKKGNITYLVNNLLMDVDDDLVTCEDEYNVILSNKYVTLAFLKRCLISIRKIIIDGVTHGELTFSDGYIKIETI